MLNPCSQKGQKLYFDHLGGTRTTGDPDSWFPEMWRWLLDEFQVSSVIDIGCGVGFAQRFFAEQSEISKAHGVDCDQVLEHHLLSREALFSHDFIVSPWDGGKPYDLVWCCDVAEHIVPEFVGNIVQTLTKNCGNILAFSAAPKGAGGHHHVNCQDPPYWITLLTQAGLHFQPELTQQAKALCDNTNGRSPHNYFLRSGLIFTREAKPKRRQN